MTHSPLPNLVHPIALHFLIFIDMVHFDLCMTLLDKLSGCHKNNSSENGRVNPRLRLRHEQG